MTREPLGAIERHSKGRLMNDVCYQSGTRHSYSPHRPIPNSYKIVRTNVEKWLVILLGRAIIYWTVRGGPLYHYMIYGPPSVCGASVRHYAIMGYVQERDRFITV